MTTTHEIEPGRLIDLSGEVVGFDRGDRRARLVEQDPGRPPRRIDGLSVGAPMLTGDELLYLVSGAITVELELAEGDRTVDVGAGEALVVPQGTWHRIHLRRPGRLIHITPGPAGEHRPLAGPTAG